MYHLGQSVDIINGKRCFCVLTVHIANVNLITRFSKASTGNIFTFFQARPELVLKLFLIFGHSEPHCYSWYHESRFGFDFFFFFLFFFFLPVAISDSVQ